MYVDVCAQTFQMGLYNRSDTYRNDKAIVKNMTVYESGCIGNDVLYTIFATFL